MTVVEVKKTRKKIEMIGAMTSFNQKKLTKDDIAKLLYSDARVNKIVRSVCMRHKIKEDADELKQRAILIIFEKYINRIHNPDGFYSLWYATVKNCGLELNNEHKVDSFYDQESEDILTEAASYEASQHSISLEDATAIKLTSEKFNAAFENAPNHLKNIIFEFNSKNKKETKKLKEITCAEHDILIEIKEKLNISIKDFAFKLNITPFRLSSYIYRKTKEVPKDIMERADELLKGELFFGEQKGKLKSKCMSLLVKEWCELLQFNEVQLAKFLHVSISTMNRWTEDLTRPDVNRLNLYNNAVKNSANNLSKVENKET